MATNASERALYRTRTVSDDARLSSLAPAMAYVPWQGYEALYDTKTALARGTVFPTLDLPFTGRRSTGDGC